MKYYIISHSKHKKNGKVKTGFTLCRAPDKANAIIGFIEVSGLHVDFVTEITKKEYKKGLKFSKKTFIKDGKFKRTSF